MGRLPGQRTVRAFNKCCTAAVVCPLQRRNHSLVNRPGITAVHLNGRNPKWGNQIDQIYCSQSG